MCEREKDVRVAQRCHCRMCRMRVAKTKNVDFPWLGYNLQRYLRMRHVAIVIAYRLCISLHIVNCLCAQIAQPLRYTLNQVSKVRVARLVQAQVKLTTA